MLTGGTERPEERKVDWKNRADWSAEFCLKEQSSLETGLLTEGTDRNVVWRNRADWGAEFCMKEQKGQHERNVDWRNTADWRAEC